jgi:hypothetical protein
MKTGLGGEYLDLRLYQVLTKEQGLLGLILRILREIK